MGSIESYETAAGKRYRVRYRKPDHSQAAKRGFTTKKAANDFLAGVVVDTNRGSYIDPAKSRVLLSVWMKSWMEGRADLEPTSRERVRGIIERHILPPLGAYPLSALQPEVVQAWAGTLSLTQSPSSVRKIVNVLSGCLQVAVKNNRIPFNPAYHLNLPKVGKSTKRYLTHQQVRALANAADGIGKGMYLGKLNGYGLLIMVLAYCGLRWSELSGLRVGDIDFRRGRLEVQHTVVEVDGYQIEGVPKSHEARSIPVPPSILADLAIHVADLAPEDPVFSGARSGGWLRNRIFRRGWLTAAATEAGVAGLTPHELRHTAASLAISAGANVKAVQKMLGHASASVTLDVYADLFDDDLDAVAVALDHAIRISDVSKVCPLDQNGAEGEEAEEPEKVA